MMRIAKGRRTLRAAGTRGAVVGTSALLALAAAGCGSGAKAPVSSSSHTTNAAAAPSTSATASSAAATPTTSGTAGKAVAKPGAAFAAGQTANVRFTTTTKTGATGPSYNLSVDVTSIQKGTLSDFSGIQLDASQKAGTPYYVRVRITNLGPGPIDTSENDPAIQVQGVDNTGQTQQSVTFLGTFPRCPDNDTPKPLGQGKAFSTCLTFLVPGGITKAAYTGTESYVTSPVTWTAS